MPQVLQYCLKITLVLQIIILGALGIGHWALGIGKEEAEILEF
ncbi:MAG: hypothetical protein ACYTXY_04735 [Nostoc sp.]